MASDLANKSFDVLRVPYINTKKNQPTNLDNEVIRKVPKICVESSPLKPNFDKVIKDIVDVFLVK